VHYLAWFEQTALSIGVREVWWVFPLILVVHALGMGLSAGAAFAISARFLGAAPRTPLTALHRFLPLVWIGFAANLLSGLFLLAGYPTKALTNWVFYGKLALLLAALWITQRLAQHTLRLSQADALLPFAIKLQASLALLMWAGVIVSGRLLAYTYNALLASWLV